MLRTAALATLLPLVAAHGFIKSPAPRQPGDAFKAACGEQPFYQQSADINGNVQGIKQVVPQDLDAAKCNLWLCKGFQFDDNKDNVQSYSLGEKIDFDINIAAPHTGYANVSVVKTSSDSIIGEPLIEFSNYASNSGMPANNSAFSVTLPESLGGDCTKAGDCVLQWFWDAPDIDQTYESCVDFVVGGSGSGSGSSPSAPAASAPAATDAPEADDDEECDEDEEPVSQTPADDDDEDCDDEDEEPAEGDDDEECPADEEEGDDNTYEDGNESTPTQAAAGISAAANNNAVPKPTSGSNASSGSGSGSGSGYESKPAPASESKPEPAQGENKNEGSSGSNTVTQYVTVAAQTHYVTVTADAPACTA